MANALLASAPTLAALHGAITDFYCGTKTELREAGANTWQLVRCSDSKLLEGVAVFQKKGRFRFEMV